MAVDLRILRDLTGWPEEVPDSLLYAHGDEAADEMLRLTGVSEAPTGSEDRWARSLAWLTAASALPSLHTFSLSGAAKVGRLEGGVEFRFLSAAEVAALAAEWHGRGVTLLAGMVAAVPEEEGESAGVSLGDGWMAAI